MKEIWPTWSSYGGILMNLALAWRNSADAAGFRWNSDWRNWNRNKGIWPVPSSLKGFFGPGNLWEFSWVLKQFWPILKDSEGIRAWRNSKQFHLVQMKFCSFFPEGILTNPTQSRRNSDQFWFFWKFWNSGLLLQVLEEFWPIPSSAVGILTNRALSLSNSDQSSDTVLKTSTQSCLFQFCPVPSGPEHIFTICAFLLTYSPKGIPCVSSEVLKTLVCSGRNSDPEELRPILLAF